MIYIISLGEVQIYHQSDARKKMVKYGFGRTCHDLQILKLEFSSYFFILL